MEAFRFNTYEEAKDKIDEINSIELPTPIQSKDLQGNLVDVWTHYAIDPEPIEFDGKFFIPKNSITEKYLQNNITINIEQNV